MGVRISKGYSSTNAAAVAKDVIKYEYNLADESQLLSGTATSGESTAQTD